METAFDVIVIGLGAMGSATAYHAARRGMRVLGLDMHPRGHKNGSSHGTTRIIREAYFEAPEYVPLVQRAYALWRELEAASGRPLLTITGGLNIGAPDSAFVSGARMSAQLHHLPYEELSNTEVTARFSGFRLPEGVVAVYEPTAGILDPEACVFAHLDCAAKEGAVIHHREAAHRWTSDGDGVRVETDRGVYTAHSLVITAGPWASEVMQDLALPLRVQRIVNVHFAPTAPVLFAPERCPVYLMQVPEGDYYGFPALPGEGVKIGRHDIGEICTPETIRRDVDAAEIAMLRDVLDRYLPGAAGDVLWTLTCMYTNTPDRHFILDRHSAHKNIVYGCGFSGHGFKFASAIGEVMADLATGGTTRHDIAFLSAARFAEAQP
ncbi:MAG: N-methyl-L-tryptophan oxidase [Thermomicrobia bacterium]|nr:N-methyl-L-tryptophan oxidase [Thermomicrobia bacterium]MCA1724963.1 N-methyl-L-tryptophan oxidase [Thermomicrobia bacterium]